MTLSGAVGLLRELRDRGLDLEVVGDRLRFAPVETVTPEFRQRLIACKAELTAILLASASVGGGTSSGVPLASWMLSRGVFPQDAPDARRSRRPCYCCGGVCFWRLRGAELWFCSCCHPPAAPAAHIETVTVGGERRE